MSHSATAVGGPIMTRPFKLLLGLFGICALVILYRFAMGIGAVSGLTDGYPWGIWITIDVVTGTALACGGYAVAILVYVLNKGEYHPLVRSAVLTSALGYSVAGAAIAVDVGRPWFIWRIPIAFGKYNFSSALLEVALCVMAYIVVLWIELAPALLERWKDSPNPTTARRVRSITGMVDKALPWILALGLLLPTMHQSSLGTVMLIAGQRLHPLWNTAMVPLLFLISCIAMGYAAVVLESSLAATFFKRKRETKMLAGLTGAMQIVIGLFLVIRFVDLLIKGRLGMAFAANGYAAFFWLETIFFVAALVMVSQKVKARDGGHLFRTAMVIVAAGVLYRFGAYLIAFNPGDQWGYFPTVPEMLITIGMITTEVLLYIVIVKRFPILGGAPAAASTT